MIKYLFFVENTPFWSFVTNIFEFLVKIIIFVDSNFEFFMPQTGI